MAPKRGNAKSKVETAVADAVESPPVEEIPTKKKAGKAVKIVEEPITENGEVQSNGDQTKNGTKRGRKAKENSEMDVPVESDKQESKEPTKRGRKAKEMPADKQPTVKKAKSEESENDEPEAEVEKPAAKRGRKPAAKPKPKATKSKKEDDVVDEPENEPEPESIPTEEPEVELKAPVKRGRGKKAAEEPIEKPAEKAKKRGAPKAIAEPAAKKQAAKPLQNKSATDFDNIDFNCTKTNASGKTWNFKISNWNVDGIRAWLNKGGLEFILYEKPDILCLQETKCSENKLPAEAASLDGYHAYWLNGEKEGYAGVGIYSKVKALSVQYGLGDKELDSEGRIISLEYDNFYVISTYVPNSGRGLVTLPKRLQWNEVFQKFVQLLDAKKPVIICGDMNVSHLEIDLANPKSNKKNAGFTQEERDGMTNLLKNGFVDTFRSLYPDKTAAYTFWTYMSNSRAKNVGWRLDYAIVSERLIPAVCDNIIRSEVFGSDHCPITLFLHIDDLETTSNDN